jgi:hypothetical protein
MHFVNQIKHYLTTFETDSREEIERFVDYLKSVFVEPGAPVPSAIAAPVAVTADPIASSEPPAPVESLDEPAEPAEPAESAAEPAIEVITADTRGVV